jgi:hypothetical protein
VQEPQIPHATVGKVIDPVQIALQRVGALDSQQRPGDALPLDALDIGGGANLLESARALYDVRFERVDLLVDGASVSAARHGERHQPEELRADPPFYQSRDIDVTEEGGSGKRGGVPGAKVVTHPPRPHERVRVEVDGGVGRVERSRLQRSVRSSSVRRCKIRRV